MDVLEGGDFEVLHGQTDDGKGLIDLMGYAGGHLAKGGKTSGMDHAAVLLLKLLLKNLDVADVKSGPFDTPAIGIEFQGGQNGLLPPISHLERKLNILEQMLIGRHPFDQLDMLGFCQKIEDRKAEDLAGRKAHDLLEFWIHSDKSPTGRLHFKNSNLGILEIIAIAAFAHGQGLIGLGDSPHRDQAQHDKDHPAEKGGQQGNLGGTQEQRPKRMSVLDPGCGHPGIKNGSDPDDHRRRQFHHRLGHHHAAQVPDRDHAVDWLVIEQDTAVQDLRDPDLFEVPSIGVIGDDPGDAAGQKFVLVAHGILNVPKRHIVIPRWCQQDDREGYKPGDDGGDPGNGGELIACPDHQGDCSPAVTWTPTDWAMVLPSGE